MTSPSGQPHSGAALSRLVMSNHTGQATAAASPLHLLSAAARPVAPAPVAPAPSRLGWPLGLSLCSAFTSGTSTGRDQTRHKSTKGINSNSTRGGSKSKGQPQHQDQVSSGPCNTQDPEKNMLKKEIGHWQRKFASLEHKYDTLRQTQESTEGSKDQFEQELGDTRQQLGDTQQQLDDTLCELDVTRAHLDDTEQQLHDTQQQLGHLDTHIQQQNAMIMDQQSKMVQLVQVIHELQHQLGAGTAATAVDAAADGATAADSAAEAGQ